MDQIAVELLLGEGCCIECAAKREYNRMVLEVMAAEDVPGPDVEARLDLLLDFLESADFSRLRGSDEALSGVREARCQLCRNSEGKPVLSMIDTRTL